VTEETEEKTRVTTIVQKPNAGEDAPKGGDCLVVIYTKEPTLLGKRFVLDTSPIRIGRGAENHIVLDGDSVSRRHAHLEQRGAIAWFAVDDGSTNGTYVNDEQIAREQIAHERRPHQGGPDHLQVPLGPGRRGAVPRRNLPDDHHRRSDAGARQALPARGAREGDHPRAAARARSLVRHVRHRPLQEDQRRPRAPGGRLRPEGARADRPGAHPPRRGVRALRRRGVCDRAAGDEPRRCAGARGRAPREGGAVALRLSE
jgi:hypothetical protein